MTKYESCLISRSSFHQKYRTSKNLHDEAILLTRLSFCTARLLMRVANYSISTQWKDRPSTMLNISESSEEIMDFSWSQRSLDLIQLRNGFWLSSSISNQFGKLIGEHWSRIASDIISHSTCCWKWTSDSLTLEMFHLQFHLKCLQEVKGWYQ